MPGVRRHRRHGARAAGVDSGAGGDLAPAQRIPNPLKVIGADCVPDLDASALTARLRDRIGPLRGFDNPKLVPLGGDRTLWLVTDPYVDLSGADEGPLQPTDYVHNTLLLQEGSCFSLVQLVLDGRPWEFAPSTSDRDWFWPIGGGIGAGGLLYIFWSRMVEDGAQAFLDGITRHPIETWLGVYDPATFATIRFEWAPDSGVFPQYGSAVQTAPDGFSYLFGNSNMLELSREGGYGKPTPFSGTRMYLARVPAGQFELPPTYWDGRGWSTDASAAAPISSRWSISNAMQPRLIDGVWYSAVKQDEFWGDRVVVERASAPQGPWRVVADVPVTAVVPADRAGTLMTTYQPVLLPRRAPNGTLSVLLSQNSAIWLESIADPRLYRPQVLAVRA
ncbi:MAG: hypothetical protein QM733_14435 [Ilumatobacteraceae bacterium]